MLKVKIVSSGFPFNHVPSIQNKNRNIKHQTNFLGKRLILKYVKAPVTQTQKTVAISSLKLNKYIYIYIINEKIEQEKLVP